MTFCGDNDFQIIMSRNKYNVTMNLVKPNVIHYLT